MKSLRVPFARGPLGDLKVPLTWTAAVALIVAAVIAVVLPARGSPRDLSRNEAYGVTRADVWTRVAEAGQRCAIAAPGPLDRGLGLDYCPQLLLHWRARTVA
jgi:rod shape-determining protein MreC